MRNLALSIIFFILSNSLSSQSISGFVKNSYQQPIEDVNILNLTTDHHTHSNDDGSFIFENIAVGDTLKISHISYQNQFFVIEDLSNPITVVLFSKLVNLEQVIIAPKINNQHIISDIDVQVNPVNSSQEILRKVPGLFIGQHAGGGKAEQIFLRGFDIDHGTDISITADGIPVNMVSHAHGQGYADLHFVIPETIDKIDFGKGTYYEDKGNFNTAGYVDFKTKENLENSTVKVEAGQFDSYRLLGMLNLLNKKIQNAYIATEFQATDGAFVSPQNFNRTNIFGKYTSDINTTDKVSIIASHFSSKWDASGQIPQRAVDSGLISRFGAIDDTEGGNTSRSNLSISYDKIIDSESTINSNIYLSSYDFELYSNFTFFLDDPINGDQIKQKEKRTIYGFNSEYKHLFSNNELSGNWKAGISLRNDQSKDNELSHTLNRSETLEKIKFGSVNETNIGAYVGTEININNWTLNPSLRIDYFDFQYNDALLDSYQTQNKTKAILSPKFNITYNQSNNLQLYAKTGKGFHSNDTRVVVLEQKENTLPAAYSFDLGYLWKPNPKMLLNMAYWYLYLEQEFVYVGDAGIVEPSGKTQRQGIELSYRYQPFSWLYWSLDANYTYARALEEMDGENYIPLAPDFTLVNGINIIHKSGWQGSINTRYLDNRPANEDNTIIAKGYTVTDLNIGYHWDKYTIGIQIQNLFDTDWNETQFATESRLYDESTSTEEIHFTPGTPFFIKTSFAYKF